LIEAKNYIFSGLEKQDKYLKFKLIWLLVDIGVGEDGNLDIFNILYNHVSIFDLFV
jgi:hypothetical protein